jgi:HTH-type transcriptional regulator/antitoxin HigA
MDIRPIETEGDYDWALAEVEQYFDNEPLPGTSEAARFTVLSTLIKVYEDAHWDIEPADVVDGIRAVMAFLRKDQTDLAQLLGSRSRASELLNRRRPLTMEQAWKLHKEWGVPSDLLLQPPKQRTAA